MNTTLQLLDELRIGCGDHLTIHYVSGQWCVHPYSDPNVEFRAEKFDDAIDKAVTVLRLSKKPPE